jgi:hypothetical protein
MGGANIQLTPQSVLPQLEIVEGLHQGVRLALDGAEYTVGPNAQSDIVLRDEGVLPNHAKLVLEGSELRVEATGGEVGVGKSRIGIGQGCKVRLPATVTIGKATLQFVPGRGGGSPFKAALDRAAEHPVGIAGGVLACAVAALVITQGMKPAGSNPIAAASIVDQNFSEMRDAGRLNAAATAPATTDSAVAELTARLQEAGIHTIRIGSSDGRVSAEGRLSEQQAGEWASIQRWFDGKYGSSAVLTANVAIGAISGPPPVRLQAVWFGQRPYIIAENGSRYYEGAVLESGWIVQRIAEDRVVLGKASETLALMYR